MNGFTLIGTLTAPRPLFFGRPLVMPPSAGGHRRPARGGLWCPTYMYLKMYRTKTMRDGYRIYNWLPRRGETRLWGQLALALPASWPLLRVGGWGKMANCSVADVAQKDSAGVVARAGIFKESMGLGTEEEEGYRTGPPGYIGWRNSFLRIESGAPYTFKNTGLG
jgi:hypothetical protein